MAKAKAKVAAGSAAGSGSSKFSLTLLDINGATVVVEGALALILKIKQMLAYHNPDVKAELHGLDADAIQQYKEDIAATNAWLVAHGFPTVQVPN